MKSILIVVREENPRTGKPELVASHLVDPVTLRLFPVPNVRPELLGAKYDGDIGEYVIDSENNEDK